MVDDDGEIRNTVRLNVLAIRVEHLVVDKVRRVAGQHTLCNMGVSESARKTSNESPTPHTSTHRLHARTIVFTAFACSIL